MAYYGPRRQRRLRIPSPSLTETSRISGSRLPIGAPHGAHRTQEVKVSGLVLNPPDGTAARRITVHDEDDWQLIYKHPEIRVKCLVETCDTLLTPKRMSRSGLRFLAIRSGGCSHNLVKIRVLDQEVEQDPSTLAGGGGPEGVEHLWVKGRLFRIGRLLDLDPIEEDGHTRADVLLAKPKIALEYQRWDTDFESRTEQRAQAGADATVWLFPAERPGEPKTKRSAAFRRQVWEAGGIFLAVKNVNNRREHQSPWEDATQERTARLYASGSIVKFDQNIGHLVRTEVSIARVLSEIAKKERALKSVPVFTKATGRVTTAKVWVKESDHLEVKAEYQRRVKAKVERERKEAEEAHLRDHRPAPLSKEFTVPVASATVVTEPAAADQVSQPEPWSRTLDVQSLLLPNVKPTPAPHQQPEPVSERPQSGSTWWSKLLRFLRG